MKSLIIDHLPVVPQQLHDDLEVFTRVNVLCHDIVICSIEENLAEKLDGLPFCNVAF